jgi:hypothetical protein
VPFWAGVLGSAPPPPVAVPSDGPDDFVPPDDDEVPVPVAVPLHAARTIEAATRKVRRMKEM